MKTAHDYIQSVRLFPANIDQIAESLMISGSLYMDLKAILYAYGKQCAEQALKDAAEAATAHTESRFPSVHYCECCPVVDKDSILNTAIVTP